MKFLVISVLLALLPLAGAVYVGSTGGWTALTVDKIFMSIMLLTISGVFGINALLEARDLGLLPFLGAPESSAAGSVTAALPPGIHIQSGVVKGMHFFEGHVGEKNKTVVEFQPDDSAVSRYISFIGNVYDQFHIGSRVRITYRVESEGAVLIGREQLFGFRFGKSKSAGASSGSPKAV